MKQFILFCFLVASLNLVGQEADWVISKSLELGYRIEFPEKASEGSQDIPTSKGNVVMDSFTLSSDSTSNLIYMSAVSTYPDSFFPEGLNDDKSKNIVLDNSVKGAVSNVKGNLLSDTNVKLNGFTGRLIKIEMLLASETYVMTVKIILCGLKLYLIQTMCLKENDKNKDIDKFFNSFELIKVKE